MSNLLFQPWVGLNYGKTDLGKLLIVGESHYFYHNETDYANFTKKIIQGLGTTGDNDFYIKVGHVFNPDNHLDLWSKVAFANAIQYPFKESRQSITKEQYKTVEPAIKEYLELTTPSKMIVFSKGVWDKGLPESISWGKYVETLHDEKYDRGGTVWKFEHSTGYCYGIGIHHPSSLNPYFRPDEWRPLVEKFLEKDYD